MMDTRKIEEGLKQFHVSLRRAVAEFERAMKEKEEEKKKAEAAINNTGNTPVIKTQRRMTACEFAAKSYYSKNQEEIRKAAIDAVANNWESFAIKYDSRSKEGKEALAKEVLKDLGMEFQGYKVLSNKILICITKEATEEKKPKITKRSQEYKNNPDKFRKTEASPAATEKPEKVLKQIAANWLSDSLNDILKMSDAAVSAKKKSFMIFPDVEPACYKYVARGLRKQYGFSFALAKKKGVLVGVPEDIDDLKIDGISNKELEEAEIEN